MEDVNKAAVLMSNACVGYRAAENVIFELERHVEDSAAHCWDLREKSVQIKGRFMRSKTVTVEDPVFNHEAEHEFGESLARWEDVGAGGVAAAAVEIRVAEHRLMHAVGKVLDQSPEALLHALDAVLRVSDEMESQGTAQVLSDSLKLVQQLALQIGGAYAGAAQGPLAMASLAAVLAKHPSLSDSLAGLLQPTPEDVLTVIQSIAGGANIAPKGLVNVLAQCDFAAVPDKDAILLPQALCDLMPVGAANELESANACALLQSCILSLVQKPSESSAGAAAAAEALLQMLLASSKGISTAKLREALNLKGGKSSLKSVQVPQLAEWVFSFRSEDVQRHSVNQILTKLPWDWLSTACPAGLQLHWMLGAVAGVKALTQFGGPEDAPAVRAVIDALSGMPGWELAQAESAEQARMLCMLEAPAAEPAVIQTLWRQIQATVALALCCRWITTPEDTTNTQEEVSNLLEASRVHDALSQLGRSAAAISLIGHAVTSASVAPDFKALQPTISVVLSAALSTPDGAAEQAVDALVSAIGRSVSAAAESAGDLSTTMDLLNLEDSSPETASSNASNSSERGFAAVVIWLSAFVGELTQGGMALPQSALLLTANLTKAAYVLVGSAVSRPSSDTAASKKRLAKLALCLVNITRDLPQQRVQQIISQLLSSSLPWIRVLGAWIADSIALAATLPHDPLQGWTLEQVEATLSTGPTAETLQASADAAANELFLLQEAINSMPTDAPLAAAVLWFELFKRVSAYWATLQPLLDRAELMTNIGTTAHQVYSRSHSLANKITSLTSLLDNPSPEGALELLPFLGKLEAAAEAGAVESSWLSQDWGTTASTTAAGSGFLSSTMISSLPARNPLPDLSKDLDFLVHCEQEQETALQNAAFDLRYWARSGEKAAARPDGEEAPPEEGREGDVPQSLADAQRMLWENGARRKEELVEVHSTLRQRICQQYYPADEQFLQETSDAFSDGQRIPRSVLLRDPQHNKVCKELRRRAKEIAMSALSAKEVSLAAAELYKFEYLLLQAVEKGEVPEERSKIRSKLLAVMANSIVDGTTPPAASPFVVGLFERAVGEEGCIALDTGAKLRLLPRIAAALSGGGAGAPGVVGVPPADLVVLKEEQGVRLLKACLDPDALLNAGKLREFLSTLQLVERLCRGVGGGQAAAMLASFDVQRFAVLVAEKSGAVSAGGAGSSSSSSGNNKASKTVSIEELFSLAAYCLTHTSSASTGAAILEGILGIRPTAMYAACLAIVLSAPATGRRDSMLSMLSRVPMEMLPPPLIAESLCLLSEALQTGNLDPPELPYELLTSLIGSEAVLQSMKTATEAAVSSTDAKKKGSGTLMESFSLKEATWSARVTGNGSFASGSGSAAPAVAEESGGSSSNAVPSAGGSSQNSSPSIPALGIDPGDPTITVTLHSVATKYIALSQLAESVLGAAMDAVLRALHSGGVDPSSGADHVQQLLSIMFAIAGQQAQHGQHGVWALEWAWGLYQKRICGFIAEADAATGGAASITFYQFWASLPWSEATFHLRSPLQVATIRALLPSQDKAAAQLVHALDWTPILNAAAAARPSPQQQVSASASAPEAATVGGATSSGPGVFTLVDEEEEAAILGPSAAPSASAAAETLAVGGGSRSQWAAELGLLLLHCTVFLAESDMDLPAWTRSCLLDQHDEEGDPEAAKLIAGADWARMEAVMLNPEAPWMVLPLLQSPQSIQGHVGQRVLHAAHILGRAAALEGSAASAAVAVKAIKPLFALSICQGIQIMMESPLASGATAAAARANAALAASIASHQVVDLPADIPVELLEDTVELQQYRLQQEELRLAQEESAAATAAFSQEAQQQQQQPSAPLVEVTCCFKLTPAQHLSLIRNVLGPLAAMHAPSTIAAISAEHCVPEFAIRREIELVNWNNPSLASIASICVQASAIQDKKTAEKKASASTGASVASSAADLCVALLQPLVYLPVTIITQDRLPFSNAELPWFIESGAASAAVFVTSGSAAVPAGAQRRPGRSMHALRQQISSLLKRRVEDTDLSSVDKDEALNRAIVDAQGLKNLIAQAVLDFCAQPSPDNDKRLAACLLRCIVLSRSLHNSATVTHFAENIVRALASPAAMVPPSLLGDYYDGSAGGTGEVATVHAADEVPVIPAGEEGITITRVGEENVEGGSGGGGPAATAGASTSEFVPGEPEIVVPQSMQLASAACADLEPSLLLKFAAAAAVMHKPLLAAYAIACARHAASLVDKMTWQSLVIDALKAATAAESYKEHPLDIVAPWMEVLKWIGDTRWRRLPPGPHKAALHEFLNRLNGITEVIEIVQPEELVDPADRERSRNSLATMASAAAGRLRQLGQSASNLGSSGGGESGAYVEQDTAATRTPAVHAVDTEMPISTNLPVSQSHGHTPPPGVPESIAEFEPVDIYQSPGPVPMQDLGAAAAQSEDPSLKRKIASGFKMFGKSMTQAGSKLIHKAKPDGSSSTSGAAAAAQQTAAAAAMSTAAAPAASSSSGFRSRGGVSARQLEAIEPERDVLVRKGLAAFAIASYIRSVMEPQLTRRTASGAEPPVPGSPGRLHPTHTRGNSSLTGSRHLEEAAMYEFDSIVEAREAVDFLDELATSPLLARYRHQYAPFLDRVPHLLTAMTGVGTFVAAVVRLLLPGEEAGAVLAVVMHSP